MPAGKAHASAPYHLNAPRGDSIQKTVAKLNAKRAEETQRWNERTKRIATPLNLFALQAPRTALQLQGMRAQVLDLGLADGLPILDRLRAIGSPGRRVQSDVISPLEHDSSDLVYVLPFAATEEDSWPQFRTQLFHSNRRYILVGENTVDDRFLTTFV